MLSHVLREVVIMKNNYVFKSKKIYEEFVRLYLFAENSNCSCTTVNTCPITNNNCSCK